MEMKLFHDTRYGQSFLYCSLATTFVLAQLSQSTTLRKETIGDITKVNDNSYTYNAEDITFSSQSPFKLTHHRVKRTTKISTNFYTYGIVPYVFEQNVSRTQRNIVHRLMEHFQNFTCLRFVPRISNDGQWAKDLYNLNHEGFIKFVEEDRSFGGVGNNGWETTVSCRGRPTCLKGLGHALGLIEEHRHPGSKDFLRINYEHVDQADKVHYQIFSVNEIVPGYPFDISSPMTYYLNRQEFTILAPDISLEKKDFYMFQEISDNYRCPQNNCSYFQTNCINDGYVTMLQSECACRCPEGLNPQTGCATVLSNDRGRNSCGGVYELHAMNPTVTFKKFYTQLSNCDWLINAPDGDTIALEFHEFNIPKRRRECSDEVVIRNSRIGQGGKRFCGTQAPRSIRSYFNRLMISFSPSRRPTSGSVFNVTARLVSHTSLCHLSADKGFTYRGTVNFTRNYTPCIDWLDATHCHHNPYNLEDMSAGLEGNYCRNPGDGIRPWCYVSAQGCLRQYCDVCYSDTPFDIDPISTCSYMKSGRLNLCDHGTDAQKFRCAKSCKEELFPPQPSVLTVTCSRHPSMLDSEQIDKQNQEIFQLGEYVTFRCSSENNVFATELKKYCLSNGEWSSGTTACLPCHFDKGFVLHNEFCYRIETERKIANHHHMTCWSMGGRLADVRTLEEQQYVTELGLKHGASDLYIGANDMYREGLFRFRDYSFVTWAPWLSPNTNTPGRDCVASTLENRWYATACNVRKKAVCKSPMLRQGRRIGQGCQDSRDDCQNLLEKDVDMCERGSRIEGGGGFAYTMCTRTCRKCLWFQYNILF